MKHIAHQRFGALYGLVALVMLTGCRNARHQGTTDASATAAAVSSNDTGNSRLINPTMAPPAAMPSPSQGHIQYGVVSVVSTPNCTKRGAVADSRWLEDRTIQQRAQILDRELASVRDSIVGSYTDHSQRAAIVVFHADFSGYDQLAQRLDAAVQPLRVVLRPACHSRKELADAQRVIEGMDWHPQAKAHTTTWHLDPELSLFVVTVDESTPEVGRALVERLGALVEVRLGKPHFGPRPATAGSLRAK